MTSSTKNFGAALAMAGLLAGSSCALAQETTVRRPLHRALTSATGERPLTIGPRHGAPAVVQVSPGEVYAPGGFSAHSWHPKFAQRQELRKDARNETIREATSGIYGYGLDGLGGTGFDTLRSGGYDNPNYGNSFNRYVGYNGVPTDLAFGPSFAFRHLTDHDPEEDEEETSPSPPDLGFTVAPDLGDDR